MKRARLTFSWPSAVVAVAVLASVVILAVEGKPSVAHQLVSILLALFAPSPIEWSRGAEEDEEEEEDDGNE